MYVYTHTYIYICIDRYVYIHVCMSYIYIYKRYLDPLSSKVQQSADGGKLHRTLPIGTFSGAASEEFRV